MQPEIAQAAVGWQRDPVIIDMHHEAAIVGPNVIQVRILPKHIGSLYMHAPKYYTQIMPDLSLASILPNSVGHGVISALLVIPAAWATVSVFICAGCPCLCRS